MRFPLRRLAALLSALLVACRDSPSPAEAAAPEPPSPADAFMAGIASHHGQAFAGRIVANEPVPENDPFTGRSLVMHIRESRDGEIRIPFHVGTDRSRTWILTRTETGLLLKHDHRHENGEEDAVTQYGGDSAPPGTAMRQEFPVDDFSIDLFSREDLNASVKNVWAMEIEPGRRFLYELSRPDGRLFRVEFDLTAPVETPPAPWGHSQDD